MPWRMLSSSDRKTPKEAVKGRPTKEQSCNDFCRVCWCNFKIFTAILNVGFRKRICLRSLNERMWKNVVWPIWSRNLIFAFRFEECFAKQNTWYIKLFPKAVGRIVRTSMPARSDCKASIVWLQGIYFGNQDQQSCKTSPIRIIDRTLTSGCQRSGISQSYSCVVRATHNFNPWA